MAWRIHPRSSARYALDRHVGNRRSDEAPRGTAGLMSAPDINRVSRTDNKQESCFDGRNADRRNLRVVHAYLAKELEVPADKSTARQLARLDRLGDIRFHHRSRRMARPRASVELAFEYPSIAELAGYLTKMRIDAATASRADLMDTMAPRPFTSMVDLLTTARRCSRTIALVSSSDRGNEETVLTFAEARPARASHRGKTRRACPQG